jgi:flagellar basal body-associated protein FliL
MGVLAGLVMAPLPMLMATPGQAAEETPKKEFEYIPLGDFTINLPVAGRRMSYVVVSVTLETDAAHSQPFKDLQPRLKQAVLRRLISMSERQELRPGHTDPSQLRDNLFDSLAQVQEAGLRDVVITRLLHS